MSLSRRPQSTFYSTLSADSRVFSKECQIASAVGCFAGAYTTHIYLFVGIPVFELDYSILPIATSVVGGVSTFAGPVLGAFILVPLSEILRNFGGLRIVLYGIFLVVFIVLLPDGIFPYIQRKYQQFERWIEVK